MPHWIEHQLGAYTDCNHGYGLAVIHSIVYRHIYKNSIEKFVRFAHEVWEISSEGKSQEEIALCGIDSLADFIKEIGLPTKFSEMNISLDEKTISAIAKSTTRTQGCCKKLSDEEIEEILRECR